MSQPNYGLAILIIVIAFALLAWFGAWLRQPRTSPSAEINAQSISAFKTTGPSQTDQLAEIDAFHADETNAVVVNIADLGLSSSSINEAARLVNEKRAGNQPQHQNHSQGFGVIDVLSSIAEGARHSSAVGGLNSVSIRRTLNDMTDAERGIMRLADMLAALGQLTHQDCLAIKVPIIWNNGSCLLMTGSNDSAGKRVAIKEGLTLLLGGHFGDVATSSELVQTALRAALQPRSSLTDQNRHVLETYLFAGSRWLKPGDVQSATGSPSTLLLGGFEGSDAEMPYDRRESLITIAPPGSGKSQAHVIRNLLRLKAPAIVLDIKSEAYRRTARLRYDNVGSVFVFAPRAATGSMNYNPLDEVSNDLNYAWDDARRLADLLVVPQKSDPYFENRARDLLTLIILDVALHTSRESRNMSAVIDRLYYNEEQFADFTIRLQESGIAQLVRQANAWVTMPPKQREGIFDSARNHVEVWQSPALARITERTDWTPEQIRHENGTLYLCVELADVKKYASVLRVIIGQTIHGLCREEPEIDAPIITLFLDELPRLGRMDVIEEALDVGRGFGVRLWMFCQNTGQLRSTYPNAEGMIGNCAARCYMDPDDETAEELSRYLGQRKGLIDGRQKPLAEASELKGPKFADKVIVFSRGKPPAKLIKKFPAIQRRATAQSAG